jgi:hypothetical protein
MCAEAAAVALRRAPTNACTGLAPASPTSGITGSRAASPSARGLRDSNGDSGSANAKQSRRKTGATSSERRSVTRLAPFILPLSRTINAYNPLPSLTQAVPSDQHLHHRTADKESCIWAHRKSRFVSSDRVGAPITADVPPQTAPCSCVSKMWDSCVGRILEGNGFFAEPGRSDSPAGFDVHSDGTWHSGT